MTIADGIREQFERLLVAYWRRRAPVQLPPREVFLTAPADNLQRHMNLVMPLADPTPVGRAGAVQAVAASIDELFVGLSNVGTVHFARFDLVGSNLCMFSVYDGDFAAYIRDFISVFGSVFDDIMAIVDHPPPRPCETHPAEFIEWIRAHDSLQIPGDLTTLFPDEPDVRNLSRDLVLLLDERTNIQIGRFSNYPGLSSAQIRLATGGDW